MFSLGSDAFLLKQVHNQGVLRVFLVLHFQGANILLLQRRRPHLRVQPREILHFIQHLLGFRVLKELLFFEVRGPPFIEPFLFGAAGRRGGLLLALGRLKGGPLGG